VSVLIWNPEWETGIPLIDQQHRQLLGQFEMLLVAIREGNPGDQIPPLLAFLSDYVETHFSTEEKHMQATRYPGFIDHKVIHDDMRVQVAKLVDDYQKDPSIMTVEVFDFLTDWLVGHINEHDRSMARHIVWFEAREPRISS